LVETGSLERFGSVTAVLTVQIPRAGIWSFKTGSRIWPPRTGFCLVFPTRTFALIRSSFKWRMGALV